MSGPERHPLLALTPAHRRELAKILVNGLDATLRQERAALSREGGKAAALYGVLGTGLGLGWATVLSGGIAPFVAGYGLALAAQSAIGAKLSKKGDKSPGGESKAMRWTILGPYTMARAARAWLSPERLSPNRLVLAAGLLVAVRRPVSYHLLRRLYGRAFPQAEVERAVELLTQLGYITRVPQWPGVLVVSDSGAGVLRGLGITGVAPRARRDPGIAPHLLPIFKALEARGRGMRHVEDVSIPALPVFPAREQVAAEPVAPAPHPVVTPAAPPIVAPAPPPVVVPEPTPVAEPAPAPVMEPPAIPVRGTGALSPELPVWEPAPIPDIDWGPEPEPERTPEREHIRVRDRGQLGVWGRTSKRAPWKVAAVVAGILAFGVFAMLAQPRLPTWKDQDTIEVSASLMPYSHGTALQPDGHGYLLSSLGGDLFLSNSERMDFKRPLTFKGYDMANDCRLVGPNVKQARLSSQGRFLWTEMGGDQSTGRRERCLVDMWTKTVTHDLVARNPTYGLPTMIGWMGNQILLMSEEASPRHADRWWALDVTTHKESVIKLPTHALLFPLSPETGASLLLGIDIGAKGEWELTTYWPDEKRQYHKAGFVKTLLPEDRRWAEPRHVAISPDKRFLLMTLRATGEDLPAESASLVVVSLDDGVATPLPTRVAPLPDEPIFWWPEVRGGRYRFYFNGGSPDGIVPWSGEMKVSPAT